MADRRRPRRPLIAVMTTVGLAFSLLSASSALATPTATTVASDRSTMTGILMSELHAYAGTEGPFSNGNWANPQSTCWGCDDGGPATAAATAYVLTGRDNATLLHEAEETINAAIDTRQAPDGGFEDTPGNPATVDGIQTIFFGVQFGATYQVLLPYLSAVDARRWQAALVALGNYLIVTKNTTWYANGNINLATTEIEYLAWKGTGRPRFLSAYDTALNFVIAPPQSRWPGDGLIITQTPTRADGSDGAGYFAETGVGGPGFDPEYTELQLEVASGLYLFSGDPRALRLVNLLTNQLRPLVNGQNELDTSGGTRHTGSGRSVEFMTPAYTVLSLFAGRSDLDTLMTTEATAEARDYHESWQTYNPVYRRALGNDISTSALAEAMWQESHKLTDQLLSPTAVTTGILASTTSLTPGAITPSESLSTVAVRRDRRAAPPRERLRRRAGGDHARRNVLP
jgi:hypothetical protein